MRERLLEKLICPISGQGLAPHAFGWEIDHAGRPLVETGLLAGKGGYIYPIVNFVPVMTVFETPLHREFAARHASEIATVAPGARFANGRPETGEASTQATFTEEWAGLDDDELSFVYDEDELAALHRDVWLRLPDDQRAGVRDVLDVGIGFGKEARALARLFPNAAITGIDLNLACVSAGRKLVTGTEVDPVVASLYRMPFRDGAFGHVHCQGVLHHTRSTKEGFDHISAKVAFGGTLFVWVYAAEDPYVVHGMRGAMVKAYWWISHGIFRPILSRCPPAVRNVAVHMISGPAHLVLKGRGRNAGRWTYANTVHGIRDAFTPRYAHQHGFNEVAGWFEEAGYSVTLQSPKTYERLFGSRLVGVGMTGRRADGR